MSLFSTPDHAQVYAHSDTDTKAKLIAVTPAVIDSSTLQKEKGLNGPVVLEFRKDGYDVKSLLLTESTVTDMIITADLSPKNGIADEEQLNWAVQTLFEGQRLIRVGRYDEALRTLADVERVLPQMGIIYELKGSVYYLKRQFQDALDSYNSALKLNPKSVDAMKMVNVLRGLGGDSSVVREPSGGAKTP